MLRATPAAWAHLLPGYGAGQIVMNGILAAVLLYHRTTRTAARPVAW
jgi:hypothetical protein